MVHVHVSYIHQRCMSNLHPPVINEYKLGAALSWGVTE